MVTRRTTIITILLAWTAVMFSQEIVDPVKFWSIMEEHCQPWGSTYSTNFFRFDIDTVIENTVYKKVWIAEDEEHQEWNFYGAFIREENSKVYFREMFGEEGLIYDFNLEIGDSVVINNPRGAGELTLFLSEIDSVEIVDGYRERWKLISNNYPNSEYWIRGIGSQTGVINSGTGVFGGLCGLFTLLCENENGEPVYQNPDFGSCYLLTTNINSFDDTPTPFLLRYNSYNHTVHLKMEDSQSRTIILSNISGNTVEHRQTTNTLVSFSLSGYSSGLYIITVIQEGKMFYQKFIVN